MPQHAVASIILQHSVEVGLTNHNNTKLQTLINREKAFYKNLYLIDTPRDK